MRLALYAGLAAGAAVLIAAGSLLWLRAGERVFVDKMLAAIAGCF
ncbi:hypothetical protein [Roseibium sp. RKSG952]|nr:hypothetical protein [Roseibium sp. RKSG952]